VSTIDPTTPSGAIAQQVIAALPPDVQDLINKPGKTSQRIQAAIRWAARRDPSVVARHQRRNPAIQSFEDIQQAKLHDMDVVARQIARQFRRRAALTGAVTGLPGGLWAVIAAGADVQLTAIYAVRMVADIAQAYGYDTSLQEEQAALADVLAVVAGIDGLRGVGNWLEREELAKLVPELLPRILAKMSVQITEEQTSKWVGRIIPGLGALIGGSIDYGFLRVAGNRALKHYHERFVQEHAVNGSAVAALSAPAVVDAVAAPAPAVDAQASQASEAPALDGASSSQAATQTALEAPAARPAGVPRLPADHPVPAPATLSPPQRSAGLAVLLEVLIPGTGAIYAGRGGVGLLWFLVSLLAGYVAALQLSGPLNTLASGNLLNGATLPGWLPYFVGAAVLWLLLRAILAARYARSYAQLHATQPPESHFASQLAAFAFLALLVTAGACAALVYVVASVVSSIHP